MMNGNLLIDLGIIENSLSILPTVLGSIQNHL